MFGIELAIDYNALILPRFNDIKRHSCIRGDCYQSVTGECNQLDTTLYSILAYLNSTQSTIQLNIVTLKFFNPPTILFTC